MLRSDPAPVGRLRKRASSCLAIGDPGVDLDEALDRVRAFYGDRDRRVLAQVERGSEVDEALTAAGWDPVPGGDAHFLIASLARALRAARVRQRGRSARPAWSRRATGSWSSSATASRSAGPAWTATGWACTR